MDRVGVPETISSSWVGIRCSPTRVVARVRETLSVELELRSLFDAPVLVDQARRLEELTRAAGGVLLPPLVAQERPRRVPLSYAQERLWFLEKLGLVGTAYQIPLALRLEGTLDVAALQLSLRELIRRHESLRTRFEESGAQAVQVIEAGEQFKLSVVDVSGSVERGQDIARVMEEECSRRFDLQRGPLFRATVVRVSAQENLLLMSLHHIVTDGWSQAILMRELSTLYRAFSQGQPSPLQELPVQYVDYTLWQRSWLHGEALEKQIQFWKSRLAGAPPSLELPTDWMRPAVASFKGGEITFAVSQQLAAGLRELSRREGVTLYMVLLAAFQVLLSRWSGQKNIVVGSPIAGRRHRETEALIGFFVNTLAMRGDLSGNPTFREYLRQVKETTLGAYAHQDLPFEKLVEELQPVRDLSRQPIFQVSFVLQNQPQDGAGAAGLESERVGGAQATSKFDLTLTCVGDPHGTEGCVRVCHRPVRAADDRAPGGTL